ncbi:MAG: 4a-hydroxytetrahydrobiopterin dehydratase [Pikeienuella sp.]
MTVNALPQDLVEAGWTVAEDAKSITKTFKFKNFPAAIGWMVRAGFEAEALDHHPEWRNVYNRVEVLLTTHDIGGLTEKDIALAARMEAL